MMPVMEKAIKRPLPSCSPPLKALLHQNTTILTSPILYGLGLLVSLSLIYLIALQILPPQNPGYLKLHEQLDDSTLFHRAVSLSPSAQISHFSTQNPGPKIAFLFLINADLTFAPLWEQFFSGHDHLFNVYVHADPLSNVKNPGGVFKSQFIPSKKTERGSPSLISAERRLLARAIIDDPLNLYFALVSQHCIPLHSFQYMYDSLLGHNVMLAFTTQSSHKSFIEIISDGPHFPVLYNARGENVMLPEVRYEQFRVGSQFFVLAKRHAVAVLKDDRRLWKKFALRCLNVDPCYPEEQYFPTLLSLADPECCTNFTRTNVNWSGSADSHPYVYRAPEISPQLVYRLRQSNFSRYSYFFARKFSPDCLRPLMDISGDVILKD